MSSKAAVPLDGLRQRLRESYIVRPDDSHGEPYFNRGLVSALRIVADIAGDLDFEAPCEADGDYRQTADVWCRTHIAPMGSQWSCNLAKQPWVWRDARSESTDR